MSFADSLKKTFQPQKPLWSLDEDGISNSMLTKWIECRERFRLYAIEGWQDKPEFKDYREFGNMLHEVLDAWGKSHGDMDAIKAQLNEYCATLFQQFPESRGEIVFWKEIAHRTADEYIKFFSSEDKKKIPLLYEHTFCVDLNLPSGRTVKFRGKFDGSFALNLPKTISDAPHFLHKSGRYELCLDENKIKGDKYMDIEGITGGLTYEQQTMTYLTCLLNSQVPIQFLDVDATYFDYFGQYVLGEIPEDTVMPRPPAVRYNCVKRPLSGGQYNIKKRKGRKKDRSDAETSDQFLDRVIQTMKDDPEHYFHRWHFRPSWEDLIEFQRRSLIPILEQLCDWWESIKDNPFDPWTIKSTICESCLSSKHIKKIRKRPGPGSFMKCTACGLECVEQQIPNKHHYRRPFGIYSGMSSGWRGDFFDYFSTGIPSGLVRVETTFPELDISND